MVGESNYAAKHIVCAAADICIPGNLSDVQNQLPSERKIDDEQTKVI